MPKPPAHIAHHVKLPAACQGEFLEVASADPTPHGDGRLDVRLLMAAVPVASVSQFALLAGVSRTTVYRWMRNGLDYWTADVLAIKVAHMHPALVFGPGWFGLAESDQETAA